MRRYGRSSARRLQLGCLLLALFPLPLAAATGTPPQSAQGLYVLHCSGCHRQDGGGMPPAIPDLRSSLPRLIDSAEGRDYLLRVPGVARASASDAELALIMNWLTASLGETPAQPPRFVPADIAAARRRPLIDPAAVRRQLLPDDDYQP